MLKIHGLKSCDTCRKVLKTLAERDVDAQFRDVRTDPVTRTEVARWWEALGPALLNTRSTTWRGLDEASRSMDPVDLMVKHPALIKRPVLEEETGVLHLGWSARTRADLGLAE